MAKKDLTKETGSSGVYVFNGMISGEEYNRDLACKRGLIEFDKMRRNDATINAALNSYKQPILNAEFEVDAASDDEKDQLVAKFVETNLFHRIDWEQTVGEILTFPGMGFAVFEQVFEPGEVEGVYGITLKKLGFRKQATIEAWETEDHQPGVQQYLATGHRCSIPLSKLVVFTHKQEGDNYEGISILRTAYKHWKIKDQLYKVDAVAHENHALGILDITKPKGASKTDEANMAAFAQNRRANAQSYIMKPEGWIAEFMDMKSNTLRDIMPSVQHHDRQILLNVLAQFLALGSAGAAGSRSTSEDHSRLFELAVQALARRIVHTLQNTVVRNLVDLNFSGVEYPTLRVAKISDDNIPVLSDAVSKFVAAGVLHPRPADENTLRKVIGLPEVEDEELEGIYSKADAESKDDTTKPGKAKKGDLDDKEDVKASVDAEVRALRASVEKALYEPKSPKGVQAQVSARDFPDLYKGTGVDPDNLGCIMVDAKPLPVLKHLPDDFANDLVQETTRHDHAMGAVAETEAHLTLLYGLLENGNVWKDKVDTVLDGWSLDQVEIDEVGYFDTPDSYAVVAHVKVTPDLLDGHERLTLLPHIQTFSEYHPHITLAYVKKDADIDDWVDFLGTAYNGKTIKTTGINYGNLPADKAA